MIKNNKGYSNRVVLPTACGVVLGIIAITGRITNGTSFHQRNTNPKYANPSKLEFKVKDLDSDKEKETILIDKENKENNVNYLVLRDEEGNLSLKKYDLEINYNEINYKNSGENK